MKSKLLNLAYYVIMRSGCIHPFRISRILVLANWRSLERNGRLIVPFRISGFEAGFSIDELSKLKDDECIEINEERRCMIYKCEPPVIDEEEKKIIDEILEETKELDDATLNKLIIKDNRYKDLLSKGGFIS